MLDQFLKVAHSRSVVEQQQDELVELMQKLPIADLYRLYSGQDKLAYIGGTDLEWLEKFKGSPLFEQAVQLEQESIQLEVADKQQREMNQQSWDARDQLCLKRRLLTLQLAQHDQQQLTGQPAPAAQAPAAPAAAASPSPAPAGGDPAAGATPSPKGISIKLGEAAIDFARSMGHELAQQTRNKHASEEAMVGVGKLLAKAAAEEERAKGMDPVSKATLVGGGIGAALGAPGLAATHLLRSNYPSELSRHLPSTGQILGGMGRNAVELGAMSGAGALAGRGAETRGGAAVRGGLAGAGVGGLTGLLRAHQARAALGPLGGFAAVPIAGGALLGGAAGAISGAATHSPPKDKQASLGTAFQAARSAPGLAAGLVGQRLLSAAKANPGAALGLATGAASGAMSGAVPDQQGKTHMLRGALMGGVTGGAIGHAAEGITGAMRGGASLGQAAQQYAGGVGQAAQGALGRVRALAAQPAPAAM